MFPKLPKKAGLLLAAIFAMTAPLHAMAASWKVGGQVAQSAAISPPDNPLDYWKMLSGAGSSEPMVLPNGWQLGLDAGRGVINLSMPFGGQPEFSGNQAQGLANPSQFGLIGDQYSPWAVGTAANVDAQALDHKVAELVGGLCAIAPHQFHNAMLYWEKLDARAAVSIGYVGPTYGPIITTPLQFDTNGVRLPDAQIRVLLGVGKGVVAGSTAYSWWMPIFSAYLMQNNLSPFQINKIKLLMVAVGDMPGVGRPILPTRTQLAECGWPAQVIYKHGDGATGPDAYPITFLSRSFFPFSGGNRYRNSHDAMPMQPDPTWEPSHASPIPEVLGQTYAGYVDSTLESKGFRIGYMTEDQDMLDPETLLPTWVRVGDEEGFWVQTETMAGGPTPLRQIEWHYSPVGGYSIALFSHWVKNPGQGQRARFSLRHHLHQGA